MLFPLSAIWLGVVNQSMLNERGQTKVAFFIFSEKGVQSKLLYSILHGEAVLVLVAKNILFFTPNFTPLVD